MKCKNCAAELVYSARKTKLICPYCDTEIIPEELQNNCDTPVPQVEPVKQEVLVSGDMNSISDKGKITLKEILSCTNDPNMVIDKYFEYFEARAKNDSCCAVPGINDDLLYKITQRLKYIMEPNEKIWFYRDNGLLSRAKSGIVVTNFRFFVLEKKHTVFFHYEDISTFITGFGVNAITNTWNTWIINNNAQAALNTIGCSEEQLGILIAFLCDMALAVTDQSQEKIIEIKIL